MNCERARELFPELLDPRTAPAAQPLDAPRRLVSPKPREGGSPQGEGGLEARTHLAACPDCQREFSALSQTLAALDALPVPTPSPRLRQNFYALLEEEKNSAASVRVAAARGQRLRRVSRWGWILSPAVAAALVAAGFYAGARQIPPPAAAPAADVVAMRNELKELRQLVGISILQQRRGPVSTRLQEVLVAAQSDQPSEKILTDLVNALAFDPSVNVRLRALEALFPHADHQLVSAGVLTALPREQDPLVQIELIDFLAAAGNRDATPELEKMSQNEAIDRSVRDAARRALAQL